MEEHRVLHAGEMKYWVKSIGDRFEWKVLANGEIRWEGEAHSLKDAEMQITNATGRKPEEWTKLMLQTRAEDFYSRYSPVTPAELEADGATKGADGLWTFKDGSHGKILQHSREVRQEGLMFPVAAIYFDLHDPNE